MGTDDAAGSYREEAVIRAELAAVDAALIEAQRLYRTLAARRLQLAGELVAPAMVAYLADRQASDGGATDQVAEESGGAGPAAPGNDTPRGSDQ